MARIRSVHPEMFTDESFMSLSPYAMAAWPGMWTQADDNGVFEWKPLTLKARLLPCAQVDMTAIISEYESLGMVRRFEVDGKSYGAIRNFRKYQRPEKPKAWHPLPDELRAFVHLPPTDRLPVGDQSVTGSRKSPQMEDGGCKREGRKEDSEANASDAAASPPDLKAIIFSQGLEWLSTQSGKPPDSLRSSLGRACRDYGDAAVIEVLGAAQREGPLDPVAWMRRAFQARASPNAARRQSAPRQPGEVV